MTLEIDTLVLNLFAAPFDKPPHFVFDNTNKNRWITQGEWNAYEKVLEMLENIGTDTNEEDTDDE